MSAAVVPSSAEVKEAVLELLGEVDCEAITRKELTHDLESKHGWDLSSLKNVVKESLNDYFIQSTQSSNDDNGVKEENANSDSEEEKEKPKKKGGGFTQPCQLSNELGEFLSCDVMPRTEVVKKIWDYIKENDLQNPDDRREIICDLQLQKVFKRKKITMFSMNKLLSPMMKVVTDLQDGAKRGHAKKKKLSSVGSASSSKPKKAKAELNKKTVKKKLTPKKNKDKNADDAEKSPNPNAFGGPVNLAPPLRNFLGENELLRTEVTKLMWKYIKGNELQNPENRREILCDTSLKNLFGVDSFTMFEMASLLKPMLKKRIEVKE